MARTITTIDGLLNLSMTFFIILRLMNIATIDHILIQRASWIGRPPKKICATVVEVDEKRIIYMPVAVTA